MFNACRTLTAVAAVAALGAFASNAEAAFSNPVQVALNNTCSGGTGGSFGSCVLDNSPIIIKYDDFDDSDTPGNFEINDSDFPSIDGSEFSFQFNDSNFDSGTWFYNNAASPDPLITGYGFCGGNTCFTSTGSGFSGNFDLNGPALSNISFYDTGVVPVPAALPLLGTAMAGLGLIGWRRRNRKTA